MKFYIDDILPISFILVFAVSLFIAIDKTVYPSYPQIATYLYISVIILVLLMSLSYYVHMSNRNKLAEIEKSEYEIDKILTLSTGHISKSEFDMMTVDDEMPFRTTEHEYGVLIVLTDFSEVSEYEFAKGYLISHFPKLWRVVEFAKGLGCKYINFDQDGLIYDSLPSYDW